MVTVIDVRTAVDAIGGSSSSPARWTAEARRCNAPSIRVEGASVTFPKVLESRYNGDSWDREPTLLELPPDHYWAIKLDCSVGAVLRRTVQLPAAAPARISFEQLLDVDPDSGTPTPAQLPTWLTAIDQRVAAQAAKDAETYATKAELAAAGAGLVFQQIVPAAQWSIPHPLGRRPAVALYGPEGDLMLADVTASASLVVVTYASPTAGSAVLT